MVIQYTSQFKKQYKKLPKKFQVQFDKRLLLFLSNPSTPQLHVHPLIGKFSGYFSLNVNGDLRALYLKKGEAIVIFVLIGSHTELYG